MRFTQSSAALLCASLARVAAQGTKEDNLFSERHLGKRFIDAQGNYNICMCPQPANWPPPVLL
jgi:hypothetical protein